MFSLFRNWRRRRVLARHHIPDALWNETVRALPVLSRLDADALRRLRELSLLFLHEKSIEPAGRLALDDAMRLRIATLACLLILELDLDHYGDFHSVIVYPEEFLVRNRTHTDEAGVVHAADDVLAGEAWEQGPVILSWSDIEASGLGEGFNVVAHEFAHKLDMLDGAVNGTPPLHRDMRRADWVAAFQGAYDDLLERVERGEDTWLDPYAAEDPGEFFAVCAEMFFDVPARFREAYPGLYGQMAAYFRQRPAGP